MDNQNLDQNQVPKNSASSGGCSGCECEKNNNSGSCCGNKTRGVASIIVVIILIGIIAIGMFFTKKGEENAADEGVTNGITDDAGNRAPVQTDENGAIMDTLKVVDDHLEGEVDAIGYLVVKKQELFGEIKNSAFFALSGNTSPVLTDWIDAKVKSGNSINLIDKYHMLGIGCDAGTQIKSPWMKEVVGEEYAMLKASSEANPIKVKMVFVDPPDVGGSCLSYVKEIKF